MSKKLFLLPALLLSAALFFAPGCGTDDPCKDVDCGANGTCFEGACICNEGFEGSDCLTPWADKFLGNWKAQETCTFSDGTTGPQQYNVVITKLDENTISIANFSGFNDKVNFDISRVNASDATATKITCVAYSDIQDRIFNGTATISGSTITITYTVKYSDNTQDSCTGTFTKQ